MAFEAHPHPAKQLTYHLQGTQAPPVLVVAEAYGPSSTCDVPNKAVEIVA